MRYFLVKPAHGPADFQLKLHGWLAVAVEHFVAVVNFAALDFVASGPALVAASVIVDFAHPVEFQQQPDFNQIGPDPFLFRITYACARIERN